MASTAARTCASGEAGAGRSIHTAAPTATSPASTSAMVDTRIQAPRPGTPGGAISHPPTMPATSKTARQVARKRKSPRRRKATPAQRGLSPTETGEKLPDEARALAAEVEADGGRVLATYREPLGGHAVLFAALPVDKVQPTPYQRDLSEAHVEAAVSAHRAGGPLPRSADRRAARGQLLDAQRQPPPRRRSEPGRQVGARAAHPRARGGLPDPRAQHREGAQPKERSLEVDPDGARRWRRRGRDRARLRAAARGAGLRHARRRLREAAAVLRRGVPLHRQAHRRIPRRAAGRGAHHPRGARGRAA